MHHTNGIEKQKIKPPKHNQANTFSCRIVELFYLPTPAGYRLATFSPTEIAMPKRLKSTGKTKSPWVKRKANSGKYHLKAIGQNNVTFFPAFTAFNYIFRPPLTPIAVCNEISERVSPKQPPNTIKHNPNTQYQKHRRETVRKFVLFLVICFRGKYKKKSPLFKSCVSPAK